MSEKIIEKSTALETTATRKKELFRVIKYFCIASSAGAIELISYSLLDGFTNWSYWPCYLIALVLSVVWNFTFNRKYTFKSANNVPVAMTKVFFYYLIFTPLSLYFGAFLTDGIVGGQQVFAGVGVPGLVVTIINMLINGITEFLYQRFFVFGKSIDTNAAAKKAAVAEAAH